MEGVAVGSFLKLLDASIELLKFGQHNREQLFKEIIEPLFVELQLVVDDYFALFRRTRDLALTPDGLEQSISEIRGAREALLLQRIKVREWARVISQQYDDRKVKKFADKVVRFFYCTNIRYKDEHISNAAKMVELCDYVLSGRVSKEEFIRFLNIALGDMERLWVSIAQSYAVLRVHCLSPWRVRIGRGLQGRKPKRRLWKESEQSNAVGNGPEKDGTRDEITGRELQRESIRRWKWEKAFGLVLMGNSISGAIWLASFLFYPLLEMILRIGEMLLLSFPVYVYLAWQYFEKTQCRREETWVEMWRLSGAWFGVTLVWMLVTGFGKDLGAGTGEYVLGGIVCYVYLLLACWVGKTFYLRRLLTLSRRGGLGEV